MKRKASKFAPKDVINSMPDNVVTHILDRLPIQEAVRTSILSRNWRFKWTMLSQLVLDEDFSRYLLETKREDDCGKIIRRLLLHLKRVVITKFVLYIEHRTYPGLDDEDIANWILFLSGKGIEDLTICKVLGPPFKLPAYLFSCLELKHLELHKCCFDPPASFHGFPHLLSLRLWRVEYESTKFGQFFTQCPVLENLKIGFNMSPSKVKLAEIAKLRNLKELHLLLSNLEKSLIKSSASIFELMDFLPKLQELHLDFLRCKSFTEDGATKRSPTTFLYLKTLNLSNIDLGNSIMLSFAFEIITRSPNLQTLRITAGKQNVDPPPAICTPEVDYSTTGLLQLRSVEFMCCKASEDEVCLIKYLLASSPFLKQVVIYPTSSCVSPDEQVIFAKKLLKLHRASPVAEICFF